MTLPSLVAYIQDSRSGRRAESVFRASVGQSPSFGDILKMVHPKPADKRREAFYGYMLGRSHDAGQLPELVMRYEHADSSSVSGVKL